MKITPLRDYILVRPDNPNDKERKSEFGIILPETQLDKINATQGRVIAVGKDVKDIKVGDVVIFNHRIKIALNEDLAKSEDRYYFFVKEENALAIRKIK